MYREDIPRVVESRISDLQGCSEMVCGYYVSEAHMVLKIWGCGGGGLSTPFPHHLLQSQAKLRLKVTMSVRDTRLADLYVRARLR
jgi:hypothetical protein